MVNFQYYKLNIQFTKPVLGTQPKKDTPQSDFVRARVRKEHPELEIPPDEVDNIPEEIEKGSTGFYRKDGKPIFLDYQVKGFLKEAGQALNAMEGVGVKNLKSKIGSLAFVKPRFVQIVIPEGILDPDGTLEYLERPLRTESPQGARTALARSEWIPGGSTIECRLCVYPGPLSENVLRSILDYGGFKGLGQWRNASWGTFRYTLERLTAFDWSEEQIQVRP